MLHSPHGSWIVQTQILSIFSAICLNYISLPKTLLTKLLDNCTWVRALCQLSSSVLPLPNFTDYLFPESLSLILGMQCHSELIWDSSNLILSSDSMNAYFLMVSVILSFFLPEFLYADCNFFAHGIYREFVKSYTSLFSSKRSHAALPIPSARTHLWPCGYCYSIFIQLLFESKHLATTKFE